MIAALFLLVVILAVVLVAQSVVVTRFVRDTLGRVSDNADSVQIMADRWRQDLTSAITHQDQAFFVHIRSIMAAAQEERTLLYRTLISRNATEFGHLERIAGTRVQASTPKTDRDAYFAELERDMRMMGIDREDAGVPNMPEGI